MPDNSVTLTPIRVALEDLLLDPNNPRFATSLNLPARLPDSEVAAVQNRLRALFVDTDREGNSRQDEEEPGAAESVVEIGDLISKMGQIGFVPIDQIVVRKLRVASQRQQYVVLEGNRRVSAAKMILSDPRREADPNKEEHREWVRSTVKQLDVLLLDTDDLTDEQVHHQIGVILGLRHFGSVLEWRPMAKAVNIYHEYMFTEPAQKTFALDNARISAVVTRLSVPRRDVKSALATYIAYQQLQAAFPEAPPQPRHYSLIQACVGNRKLIASQFVEQDQQTFQLSAATVERLNLVCEFQNRDDTKGPDEPPNILSEDKSVSAFAGLVADAASHSDTAVRAFAASLRDQVLHKERPLSDAVDNLKSFKSERAWTEALAFLLKKVVEPGQAPDPSGNRLRMADFHAMGNELSKLEQAQKAFKNVRLILNV